MSDYKHMQNLAYAVLELYIKDGLNPLMDEEWLHILLELCNIQEDLFRKKCELLFGERVKYYI